jgi:hypothetical protein
MSIHEKIDNSEAEIKALIEELRQTLNQYSKVHKSNPNGWTYLTALSYSHQALTELNVKLKELSKNT